MDTLDYIVDKFDLTLHRKGGTEISNVSRTIMAQTLGELGFKEGAEIGTAEGDHAEVLCKNNPGVKLHCVDVWSPYPGYLYREDMEKVFQEAVKKLSPYKVSFYKMFSMDAIKRFKDNSLDFVYIDAGHDFKNIAMDISEWSKKVKPGGIVFGHDYIRSKTYGMHVREVVPAYVYAHSLKSWFVLKNDTKDPAFRKDCSGWMFIRSKEDEI